MQVNPWKKDHTSSKTVSKIPSVTFPCKWTFEKSITPLQGNFQKSLPSYLHADEPWRRTTALQRPFLATQSHCCVMNPWPLFPNHFSLIFMVVLTEGFLCTLMQNAPKLTLGPFHHSSEHRSCVLTWSVKNADAASFVLLLFSSP